MSNFAAKLQKFKNNTDGEVFNLAVGKYSPSVNILTKLYDFSVNTPVQMTF